MMKSESESYKAAGVDITETIGFTKNRSKTAETLEEFSLFHLQK